MTVNKYFPIIIVENGSVEFRIPNREQTLREEIRKPYLSQSFCYPYYPFAGV